LLTCYIDESGTDSNSSIAVVGGIVLDPPQFFWLDIEWRKCLDKHHIPSPLHMREFGLCGKFKDLRSEERRALFTDISRIINDCKTFSIASVLSAEQYRIIFAGLSEFSMYGACFTNLVMLNGIHARREMYPHNIGYLLDSGNQYKHDVLEAHAIMLRRMDEIPLNVGDLAFDSDEVVSALQAADVVSWSVRRQGASKLKSGFEPLAGLFHENHLQVPYKQEWMEAVANTIRAKVES